MPKVYHEPRGDRPMGRILSIRDICELLEIPCETKVKPSEEYSKPFCSIRGIGQGQARAIAQQRAKLAQYQ